MRTVICDGNTAPCALCGTPVALDRPKRAQLKRRGRVYCSREHAVEKARQLFSAARLGVPRPDVSAALKGRPAPWSKDTMTHWCEECKAPFGRNTKVCPRCRTEKVCTRCRKIKPMVQFCVSRKRANGRGSTCKSCALSVHRMNKYGITDEQFIQMLVDQDGKCAVCGIDAETYLERSGHEFSVDHDHGCCPDSHKTCGLCLRGLLCHLCNIGIGNLQDSVEVLQNALNYLESWGVPSELS